MDGAVVGIEEFVDASSRLVVHGRIKTSPEDFVVQEIDVNGDVVEFSRDCEQMPTESEREEMLKEMEEAQKSQKEKRERMVFEEPASGWKAALTELIGDDFGKVESVAHCQIDECFLASPTEFKDRVYLQECIQNSFPGLDCKLLTTSTPDSRDEALQIHVLLDPVYKKLRDGSMALNNCDRLLTFLRKGAADPAAAKGLELEHDDTKEARTVLHRLISKSSSCFKTKTETRNGVQRLVVHFLPKSNKKRKRSQPQAYLRFTLQKTNQEHFTCFEKLARLLKRPVSAFSYAGTKDKAAITLQHVVVSGVTPEQVLKINGDAAIGIRVGDLKYVPFAMALGGANGNKFTIVLRELSIDKECDASTLKSTLEAALESVKRHGFANYFGFQRVGLPTSSVRAHHIGEKIIAAQWEDAARLLLAPQAGDSEEVARAKSLFLDSHDVDGALKLMPFGLTVERQVLQGLKRYGGDAFEQAVKNVPFSRRVMYMHAYQSYLFNCMASFRLRHSGAKLVAGDVIYCSDGEATRVKAITADEAATLNQRPDALSLAVLPLPGTSVTFPSNATKDECVKLMEQHGTRAALCEAGPVKGAYRSLVSHPHGLEWTWQEADSNDTSLKLSFSLDSGSFATMCLREILHSDI